MDALNPTTTTTTRALSLLLLAQGLLIASPITTLDNLLTGPRAVGAQAARADLAATITAGLPFVTALVALTLLLLAFAVRRRSSSCLHDLLRPSAERTEPPGLRTEISGSGNTKIGELAGRIIRVITRNSGV